MRAYDEDYLVEAKRNLGYMFDYMINVCGVAPKMASILFVYSG